MPKRLSEMEWAFILAMEEDPSNATEAARKAGYKHPHVQSAQLMAKPKIATEVERRIKAKRKDCGIDAREAVKHLAEIAMFDPLELVNDDDSPKNLRDIPPHVRQAVKDIRFIEERDKDGNVLFRKVVVEEMYSKLAAWDQICKLLGLNKEKPAGLTINQQNNTQENHVTVVMKDDERIKALRALYAAASRSGAAPGAEALLEAMGSGGGAENPVRPPDPPGPVLGLPGIAHESGGGGRGPVAGGTDEGGLEESSRPLF